MREVCARSPMPVLSRLVVTALVLFVQVDSVLIAAKPHTVNRKGTNSTLIQNSYAISNIAGIALRPAVLLSADMRICGVSIAEDGTDVYLYYTVACSTRSATQVYADYNKAYRKFANVHWKGMEKSSMNASDITSRGTRYLAFFIWYRELRNSAGFFIYNKPTPEQLNSWGSRMNGATSVMSIVLCVPLSDIDAYRASHGGCIDIAIPNPTG